MWRKRIFGLSAVSCMLLSSKGHDFWTNVWHKMRVCKQLKPYKIYLSVNLLFIVCVKTVTNDTVKGTGFATVKVRWSCIFAQNIGLQVPHSGVRKTHAGFHIQIRSCQLPVLKSFLLIHFTHCRNILLGIPIRFWLSIIILEVNI
jgi:hypothetical protein